MLEVGKIVTKRQFNQFKSFEHNEQDYLVQLTVPLAAIQRSYSSAISPLLTASRMINAGLARLHDPQPEGLFTQGLRAVKPGINALGLLPILTLISTFGLLIVSFSYYLSRYGNLALEISFFLGLLLIFIPNLVRLMSQAPTRIERICLLCVVGICFYLVLLMQSPLHFSNYDEFLNWRTAIDIARSSHLFSKNPLLPVSPYFPGLEMLTNALGTITGLSPFYAGIVIISAARLLMILSLFLLYEQFTKSSRMAGIAVIIYMANPHFLIFDAIFSYETLALPLATCMLYILARFQTTNEDHRWIMFAAYLILMALTITHHMTDYVFVALLMLWAIVSLFRISSLHMRITLATISLFGAFLALAYAFLFKGNPVSGYLSQYFGTAFNELEHIIAGTSTARQLFVQGALRTPLWDELLMIASVGIVTFGLPFGLLCLWRHYRHDALAITFGIASIAYPVSQTFRFTNFGAEITDRAAAFLFLPIAYVLTIFITHFWPTRKLNWKPTLLIVCVLSIVLLGGIIVESGPEWSSLPGPYLVVADARSITPEGIQTASWTLSHLGPGNRVGTDRINQILMLTYGNQSIVNDDENTHVSTVFFSSHFGPQEIAILRQAKIRYLVVDLRLSTSLPLVGFYFTDNEANAFQLTRPITREALTKFNAIPQIYRIYDSGDIVIYDIGTLINGS